MSDAARLAGGVRALGLALDPDAQARLLAFRDLLARWNRVYNLTAVREPAPMVERHLLDSLAVLPHLAAARVLDVGSGAGLPGIPLAIARPEAHFVLLDSRAKRARFLRQALIELGLANAEVAQTRAEDYRPEGPFGAVVSRAFASLGELVRAAGHLVAPAGELLAMKGALTEQELGAVPEAWRVVEVIDLRVPGLTGERRLVRLGQRA